MLFNAIKILRDKQTYWKNVGSVDRFRQERQKSKCKLVLPGAESGECRPRK